jgi:MFS family permease
MKQKEQEQINMTAYYGWTMVGLAALQIFFSGPGQTYSISNWKKSYTEEFGWSQNQISFLYATATTTSACIMPFVGRAVDKYGQRRMSLIVSCGLVCACLVASTVNSSGVCWLSFFMLRFFGQGSMSLIPNTVIPHWFDTRRGRAFSFTAIGGFISAVGFPLVDTWLILQVGWRQAWVIISVFIFTVFIPCTAIWYRDRPEDVDEICEGHAYKQHLVTTSTQSTDADIIPASGRQVDENWTLPTIMHTRSFWVLMHCNLERAAVNTALTFFIRDIGFTIGISELQSASLLSLQAFIGFPVTLGVGFLLERIAVHHALAATFFLQSIALFILTKANNMSSCIFFSVVWGVASGFEQISLQMIWPAYYGKSCLGAVSGSSMTSAVLGSALGPMLWGFWYDNYGHNWNMILSGTIPWALFTGLITFLFARKPLLSDYAPTSTSINANSIETLGATAYTPVSNPTSNEDDEDTFRRSSRSASVEMAEIGNEVEV